MRRLRIANLTPPALLQPGHLYALVGEDDAQAAALLWGQLLDAAEGGHSAWLVSPPGIGSHLAQSGLAGPVHAAIASGRLSVFEADPKAARSVLDDIHHWTQRQHGLPDGMRPGQWLVINGAETLLPALDLATLRRWRDHAEQQGRTVVLVFRERDHSLAALLPHASVFTGLAQLKSRYGLTSLEIFHWFSGDDLLARQTYPIRRDAHGALETYTVDKDAPLAAVAAPAADEAQYIAMKSAFPPQEKPPTDWRIVEDDPDLLLALAAGAVAATLVLPFTPGSNFDRMARAIFDLRKRCGPRLKILIREINTRLRYNQETLAIRLGANLIVPAELSTPRFLSLSAMVQGQVFPHSLPSTYEQALKEAMPKQDQGYLPPAEFTQSVMTALAHSRVLGIQVALIHLPLAYGLMPVDALRYCKVKRAGDIYTADKSSVYLFLYACRENDIDATLNRLFTLPVGELFSSDDRLLSQRTIEDTVREFESRRSLGTASQFPDLAEELARVIDAPSPQTARPSPAKLPKDTLTPPLRAPAAPVRYPAPPLAVQSPLVLRSPVSLTDVSKARP